MKRLTSCLALLCLALAPHAFGAAHEPRAPQYPLKTARGIYTDAMIQQARDNAANYASASKLADAVIKAAVPWLERGDDAIRALIATADVPRAFNVGTAGCPTCGKAIYEKAGTYPWVIDLGNPFKVTCPICNKSFPDNDFKAYYETGLSDKSLLKGDYVDDGWGWVGPDGERYWFVGYANHWTIHSHIIPGLRSLAMAYLLTDDPRYAHKAAVILARIADVYPAMDYHNQSRYGQLMEEQGGHYPGKLVNCIWETGTLTTLASAYDAVWPAIDGDSALKEALGMSGEEIRAHIEANILEEGVDGVLDETIRGNFGMHQRALTFTALARQRGDTDAWLDRIFSLTGCSTHSTGLNYALYNLVYRDGAPYETSPGYNSHWVKTLTRVAQALRGTERSVYHIPKFRRLYDLPLDLINLGKFTPALGDSSNVYGGLTLSTGPLQAAYRVYGDPRHLAWLTKLDAVGDASFTTHDSLFLPPIEGGSEPPETPRARLLDGYGMAILNNPADTVSMSIYYGFKGGHGHSDRLGFELFACGVPIMPDLGYPDFMNGFVPGIYTWSKSTISHNTLTVDASRQPGNCAGTVLHFGDGPFVRSVEIEAAPTYPACTAYRRHMVMVDVDAERSYYVDFFTATGGTQHDYSLHGPPGEAELVGGAWLRQETGTLAGEDVELGEIYDDPVRGKPGYKGTYYGYYGSGFQHLFDVRRLQDGDSYAQFTHEKNPEAKLRVRLLNPSGARTIAATAQVSPVKHKQHIQYLIGRHEGQDLDSLFASVLEPYAGEPFIRAAQRFGLKEGAVAVVVEREGGVADVVIHNSTGESVSFPEYLISTDAPCTVVTLNAESKTPLRVFRAGGTALAVAGRAYDGPEPLSGAVVYVDALASRIRVRPDALPKGFEPTSLAGRVVHFVNGRRRTAHPIQAAALDGGDLVLTTRDDLLIGRAYVTQVEEDAVRTNTPLMFAPLYAGAYLAGVNLRQAFPVDAAEEPGDADGSIRTAQPLPADHPFKPGEDVWLVNVWQGDRLDLPALHSWTAAE